MQKKRSYNLLFINKHTGKEMGLITKIHATKHGCVHCILKFLQSDTKQTPLTGQEQTTANECNLVPQKIGSSPT